jgi:hypothetical protein
MTRRHDDRHELSPATHRDMEDDERRPTTRPDRRIRTRSWCAINAGGGAPISRFCSCRVSDLSVVDANVGSLNDLVAPIRIGWRHWVRLRGIIRRRDA